MKKVIKKLAMLAIVAVVTTIVGIILTVTIDNPIIISCMNALTGVYAVIAILIFVRNIRIEEV